MEGLLSKVTDEWLSFIRSYDIVCFTETFLLHDSILDCLNDFVQFHRPAIKLSHQGRPSGGVLLLVKKCYEQFVSVIDCNKENMIAIKIEKACFSGSKDVILYAGYVCPQGSPFYDGNIRQNVLNIIEDSLLDNLESYENADILLCGDFNSRTGKCNLCFDDDADDTEDYVRSDQYCQRQSKDQVINQFGRMLLDLCSAFQLVILNGNCKGDREGNFTYISREGSSVIDYFICSQEMLPFIQELKVIERFESKHMPVDLLIGKTADECDNGRKDNKHAYTDRLTWDDGKTGEFNAIICSEAFKSIIERAQGLITISVDRAVDCLTDGLTAAADCMKKKSYSGPRLSAWFDCECKAAKREMRRLYRKYRNTNDTNNTERDRQNYVESRNRYRQLIKEKSEQYKKQKLNDLMDKSKDSKQFWKEVRALSRKAEQPPSVGPDDWFKHFNSVLGGDAVAEGDTQFDDDVDEPPAVDDLDKPITRDEIIKAVNHLKNNKAPGPDGVLAEMLKNSIGIISPFLEILFNHMFNTGQYPTAWASAIIVPLHKNGDRDSVNNYRGISLLNILSKVFSFILNQRLTVWADENEKIVEEQGGFRAGRSTTDNIFILQGIIEKYLTKKSGKIYVCFVDFQKAFDTVRRGILWNVLRRAGVGGKMLKILQSMYVSVKSCVRYPGTPGGLTDYFNCPFGVRQGCVLSPSLFSFFINELAYEISKNGKFGIQLMPDVVEIMILLFADDVVLTSYCAKGLQTQINLLKQYADKFLMSVNLSKTKIIVFRKGGFLGAKEAWWYGDQKIDVVNSYKYLGLHFSTKLSLTQSVAELAAKAKIRTVRILRCLWKLGAVDCKVFFKIYDAQVLPVLLYGSEVWGFKRFDVLERAHLFACKRILNVGTKTPNAMVLGDLGRMPIFVHSATRCIKYWLRLLTLEESRLPKKTYTMLYNLSEQGKKTWPFFVKEILFQNGFGQVWLQQGVGSVCSFLNAFKVRLTDQYRQTWHSEIHEKERFSYYKTFKNSFVVEPYLSFNIKKCLKLCFVQFRFGFSPILVHKHRFESCTEQQLICPACKQAKETEDHILFHCQMYSSLRQSFDIFKHFNSSSIMCLNEEKTVKQLSVYLYKVFQQRKQF